MSHSQEKDDSHGFQKASASTNNHRNSSNQQFPHLTQLHRDSPSHNGTSHGLVVIPKNSRSDLQRSTLSTRATPSQIDHIQQLNSRATLLQRDNIHPNPPQTTILSREKRQPPPTQSLAPPNQRSIFQSQNDSIMAIQQTKYSTLKPVSRQKQDAWAFSIANLTGACLQGFQWLRKDSINGYICSMGSHIITDDLIAEGKGGCYGYSVYKDFNPLVGPWYKNDDGIWVYCGDGVPRGTINPKGVTERFGEYCGIEAVGWVEKDVYRDEDIRYKLDWEFPY